MNLQITYILVGDLLHGRWQFESKVSKTLDVSPEDLCINRYRSKFDKHSAHDQNTDNTDNTESKSLGNKRSKTGKHALR